MGVEMDKVKVVLQVCPFTARCSTRSLKFLCKFIVDTSGRLITSTATLVDTRAFGLYIPGEFTVQLPLSARTPHSWLSLPARCPCTPGSREASRAKCLAQGDKDETAAILRSVKLMTTDILLIMCVISFQDLLQLQYEGVAVYRMFNRTKVNVNLLIFLLNTKFFGK